jgi:hypothetical protein
MILNCWTLEIPSDKSPKRQFVMRAYCLHGGKGAFILILKLDLAYQGLLKLSRVELHKALVHLGQ